MPSRAVGAGELWRRPAGLSVYERHAAARKPVAAEAARLKEALDATSCQVIDKSGGCGQSYSLLRKSEASRS